MTDRRLPQPRNPETAQPLNRPTTQTVPPLYPENALVLAPLCGYTDYPFRQSCRRYGCRYAFTPLVEAGSLAYANRAGEALLYRGPDEEWLGIQLLGSRPDLIEAAVRRLNDHRFEVLDFNLGCPVPKVTKRGAGVALAHELELAAGCVEILVRHSRFPVTAKTRVLDAVDPAPTVRLAQALEAAGVRALTLHGRTWRQIYSGPVHLHVVRAVRESVRIPVIANGGVFDAAGAAALRAATGCSRLMIARGAIGNPWIFCEMAAGAPPLPPVTRAELAGELETHVQAMVAHYGEEHGLRLARKIIMGYLKGRGFRHSLKDAAAHLADLAGFLRFMEQLRGEPGLCLQRHGPPPEM